LYKKTLKSLDYLLLITNYSGTANFVMSHTLYTDSANLTVPELS